MLNSYNKVCREDLNAVLIKPLKIWAAVVFRREYRKKNGGGDLHPIKPEPIGAGWHQIGQPIALTTIFSFFFALYSMDSRDKLYQGSLSFGAYPDWRSKGTDSLTQIDPGLLELIQTFQVWKLELCHQVSREELSGVGVT